jgi:hypothetical protein
MRDALARVAASFPNAPPITGDEETGFEIAWTNEHTSAGLRTFERQVFVFLAEAIAEVTSISAATELLRGIFEDRVVAVAAFSNEALLRCYIAPANDIGAGLNSPNHFYLGPIATPADEVRIVSWSGELEATR